MFSPEEIPVKQFMKYFGPAKVLDKSKDGKSVLLGIVKEKEIIQTWGRAVSTNSANFSYGDTVLTAADDDRIYILGLLETASPRTENKLFASNGSYASLLKNEQEEKIQVYSGLGELVFEYYPVSGKSIVNMLNGDIEFASKGNINFTSQGNINLKSGHSIKIESSDGILMSVKSFIDKIQSSFTFDRLKMKLNSPNLNIVSKKADLQIDNTRYVGNSFSAVLKHSKLIAGKFESIANDVIIRAKNIYKTVDELMQLKTGRMRTIVKSTLHIKSKNSYQYSEEDFKVNAEKIHLG